MEWVDSTQVRHLKRHSGEKSNKCNQSNYASSRAGALRIHLKTHSGEKSLYMKVVCAREKKNIKEAKLKDKLKVKNKEEPNKRMRSS